MPRFCFFSPARGWAVYDEYDLQICLKGAVPSDPAACNVLQPLSRNAADVILTVLFGRYAGSKNYLATRSSHVSKFN